MTVAPLDLFVGPMFSGKTDRLIDVFLKHRSAGRAVVAIKPESDTRHPPQCIVSHSGRTIPAESVKTLARIIGDLATEIHALCIDEIQFFGPELVGAVGAFRDAGVEVAAAGLDRDFRREPFVMTTLLAGSASSVTRLTATCTRCGADASVTQRFLAGRPAPLDDPLLLVGDKGVYEPRCERCWQIEREAMLSDETRSLPTS